jgi:hypothetical protein
MAINLKPMTADDIKAHVRNGKRVFWCHKGYEVIQDAIGQWLIKHESGDVIGLTHKDGKTLNGRGQEFMVVG